MGNKILIVVSILALMNIYVAFGLLSRWDWLARHTISFSVFMTFFFIFQLLAFFGDHLFFPLLRTHYQVDTLITVLEWLSYTAFGVLSCLFIFTIVMNIVSVIWGLTASRFFDININQISLLLLGLVTLGTLVLGIRQAVIGPVVRTVEVPIANLPAAFDGFKIAQISDLHVGSTIKLKYTTNVVNMVNALNPDIIVLTGDFADAYSTEVTADLAPLGQLKALDGVYYVTGNHEYYWDPQGWIQAMKGLGARVLSNEHVIIHRGNSEILLGGVTDYSTRNWKTPEASSPQRALLNAPKDIIKILLAHQPITYFAAQEAGFDLQISGHTHGGQYFPFNLLIGFFQTYYKGLNQYKNMWIYVNTGTGYWGPPLRAGVPSEISLIILKPAP